MKTPKFALFAYAFPHGKTQDFLNVLTDFGHKPEVVFASPRVKLNLPPRLIEKGHGRDDLKHPEELCAEQGIEYLEIPHNSKDLPNLIASKDLMFSVVAGARILKEGVIESFPQGIINFHPGLLPENRGLDASVWAVYQGLPQGMTVHFINPQVDAGEVHSKFIVPIYQTDDLLDIDKRIYDLEVRELPRIMGDMLEGRVRTVVPSKEGFYHPPSDEKIDRASMEKFEKYRDHFAFELNGWRCPSGIKLSRQEEGLYGCLKCNRQCREVDGVLDFH